MKSWGVEVKPGQSFHVNIGEGKRLYLTQASLGEAKKETSESISLFKTADNKRHLLGTLHPKTLPQKLFDWVLKKDFQISHNWKHGSVFFYGYKNEFPNFEHDNFPVSEDDTRSDDDEQSEKKRPKAAASKTPSANKKAKKTEGKEAGVATPRPSKQAAGGNKSNQKFPTSDGAHILKPCKRHTSK